ncbi:MAG TPA: hypothetical protein VGL05_06015 [Kribbella sp.]
MIRQALVPVAGILVMVATLNGCAGPDDRIRQSAAQSAEEAVSEVNTTRLTIEQLRAHKLWPQPAGAMVGDAEKGLEQAASSFSAQQPSTPESRRVYEQTTKALDDAQSAVTAVRIALGNDNLAAAERQLVALRTSSTDLGKIAELAK